jgi:hypothetical protein
MVNHGSMTADAVPIFQLTDLANDRGRFVDAARHGEARLRDKDGTSLVMVPEGKLRFLEDLARWSSEGLRLRRLLARDGLPSIADLGSLAWLRVFDASDLQRFEDELQDSLIAAMADGSLAVLHDTVETWRVTARELEDPLRRSVLYGDIADDDFVEADEQ